MPRFEPFRAARYALGSPEDISPLVSPPYDVFGEEERGVLASSHPANIVRVDYPVERDGAGRYDACASVLAAWVADGTVRIDDTPSFTLYRMSFVDDAGRRRETVGVIGALEVVDEGAGGVLPHERTTPKAKTDRLDLTRATKANLSAVWGLSLTSGLSALLAAPGETVARTTDPAGVVHTAERVSDPARISEIASSVSTSPVLIADGHHRYAISRTYRDEQRANGGTGASELVMTYVAELVAEQLSIAAIHRLVTGHSADEVLGRIAPFYDTEAAGPVGPGTLAGMESSGGCAWWTAPGTGRGWPRATAHSRESATWTAHVSSMPSGT